MTEAYDMINMCPLSTNTNATFVIRTHWEIRKGVHALTWMKLEDIMISELSQSREDEYCMILFVRDT